MPREVRVNTRLALDVGERFAAAAATAGTTPAGLAQMLIREYLGDITSVPRPTNMPTTTATTGG